MEGCLSLSNGSSRFCGFHKGNEFNRYAVRSEPLLPTRTTFSRNEREQAYSSTKTWKQKSASSKCLRPKPNIDVCRYSAVAIVCQQLGQSVENSTGNGWKTDSRFSTRRPLPLSPYVVTCPTPQTIQNTEGSHVWRLDEELLELKTLQSKLMDSKTMAEKVTQLERNWRVRSAFGNRGRGLYVKPVIELAMNNLSDYEIFLIKCLIAIGQEHVLDVPYLSSLNNNEEQMNVLSGGLGQFDQRYGLAQEIPKDDMFCHVAESVAHWEEIRSLQDSKLKLLPSIGVEYGTPDSCHQQKATNEPCTTEIKKQSIVNLLQELVKTLEGLEKFYDCIGGIVGYQVMAVELIRASEKEEHYEHLSYKKKNISAATVAEKQFHMPEGPDLSKQTSFAAQAAGWGLEGFPDMGEIYPLGGAGDRLGLVDDFTGEALPVAMLPYCGRTLLEGLIRDLQAREFLYFKVFNKQVVTPVAIMTSASKKNNERVKALCENHDWFGRGSDNFHLFEQPLVPTVAADDGRWLVSEPLVLVLKPGGHGVIWKLASDEGVFGWFYGKGRKAAIVRQISNPVAATDETLLALSGIGLHNKKKFGFASCKRDVGTAEGVNVMIESMTDEGLWKCGISCIEYTEFTKLGIADVPVLPGSMQAKFPANTNVLFVDLKSVEQVASSQSSQSLPGMILNLRKPVAYTDYLGIRHSVRAGRVECTMQNIADSLMNQFASRIPPCDYEKLDTFIIYNHRRKVTSSAKRRRKLDDHSLHQTPDGSFLDVTRNAFDLLTSCEVKMPQMEGKHCYIESGPPCLIFLHPSLGPLWEIIHQKIRGGSLAEGSELQLEVAEFAWDHVELDGSLLIQAQNIVGSLRKSGTGETTLQYGIEYGRCRLQRVRIVNKGVNWDCPTNVFWQHRVERFEALRIHLQGNAEFYAHDVTFQGPYTFEVPEGHRLLVTSSDAGILCRLDPLPPNVLSTGSWYWSYTMLEDGHVKLKFVDCL